MPSSPTPCPSIQHVPRESQLLALLGRVSDPRDPRGVRHPLAGVLAVGIAAVLAGARSFTAIGEWAAEATDELLNSLGATRCAPDEATFRRLFAKVDADTLDRLLGAFMWTRAGVVNGRRVIAIDGKTLRGARGRGEDAERTARRLTTPPGPSWGSWQWMPRATRSLRSESCSRASTSPP